MSSLYELTNEYQALLEMAEDPDLDPEVFSDTLEGLGGEIEIKADGYAKVMKTIESQIAGIKAEEARLGARRKVLEGNIDRMKRSLQQAMEITGKTKFRTELFNYAIQKNPASLHILQEELIPAEFRIPQPDKVNTAAVKDWLKAGNVCDWAELTQSESLRIR